MADLSLDLQSEPVFDVYTPLNNQQKIVPVMFNRRKQPQQDRIAIDLGAYHTRFYSATDGLVLDEPSIGAIDVDHPLGGDAAILAFGNQTAETVKGQGERLRTVQPVQSDSHNDLGFSQKMLGYFLTNAMRSGMIKKHPEVSLVLPHGCDPQTAKQLLQICRKSGALKVDYQDAAMTAFLGSPLALTNTGILIDFGATSSRLIAVANNEVQYYQTLNCGGDDIDQALCAGLLENFELHVTEDNAREVKHHIGAATPQSLEQHSRPSIQLNCLSLKSNSPTQFRIGAETVSLILQPILEELSRSIRLAIAAVDQNIKDATVNSGIQLVGGGAMLSRMDQLVMGATDLPATVVNRPLTCSVRGAASQLMDPATVLELVEPV